MTLPQDVAKLQSEMNAAVREHWKAFLIEGILLVVLGLAAMIAAAASEPRRHDLPGLDVSDQRRRAGWR